MTGPTPMSVTNVPCSCGYLAREAQNPHLPIKFDADLNEYSLEHVLPTGAKMLMMIYHCPMCGGVASESKRDKLFADVPDEEARRLAAMTGAITTVEEIEARLGAADEDRTLDSSPEVAMVTGKLGPIRVLTFSRLSATADVTFSIYPDGAIQSLIAGKYIGAADGKPKSPSKKRRRSSRSR